MASMHEGSAAPSGQLKAAVNWPSMIGPSMIASLPPRMRGSMKEPITGTKIRKIAASMPGMLSGSMMRKKVWGAVAPRLRAASISDSSIAWSEM